MKNLRHNTIVSLDDKIQYYLMIFLRASIVLGGLYAAYNGLVGAFLYSVLSLVLTFLPQLIKIKVNLPIEFDFILVIFMYAAVFLGKAGLAYDRFWWWDLALHTSSGFILGFIAFLILYIKVEQKKLQASRLIIGLLIFSVGLAFGALWEVFEYLLALIFGGNITAAGLKDTIGDLTVDSIGALVIAWAGVKQIFDKSEGFIARWARNFTSLNRHLEGAPDAKK